MIAFGPIVILALCLLAAWMGVMAVLRVCSVPKGVEPGGSCGSCNYPYSGWQRCPECGGDVKEEGIATPRLMLKHRGSLRGALFSLTMLAGALVFLLTGITLSICQAAGWMQWTRQSEYTLERSTSTPVWIAVHWDLAGRSTQSRAHDDIVIAANSGGTFLPTASLHAPLVGVAHARIDARRGTFVVVDPQGHIDRRGDRFQRDDAVRLLELVGVSVEQTVLEAAGLQLAELADTDSAMAAASMRPATTFTGATVLTEGSSSTRVVPSLPFRLFGLSSSSAAMLLAGILSAALYVLALWLVLKRRRRLMKRIGPVTQPSSLAGV